MVPWGRLLYVSVMGISNDLAHSSGPDIARYKFATYERDEESGLDNANARMYNSASGNFTSADTVIPGDGERSMGFNRYAYTEGNPVKYNDPSGHGFIAPGHNYSGDGQRNGCEDFSCPGATSLDEISKLHDEDHAVLFGDSFNNFGKNIDVQIKNISADAKFIGRFTVKYVTGALLIENVSKAHDFLEKHGFGKVGSWAGAVILGALYTAYDIVIGSIGVLFFTANIIVNAIAAVGTLISKAVASVGKFFKKLFDW